MRELVTVEQVDRLFLWLAIAAPVVGVLLGAGFGARRGKAGRGAVNGLLIGLLGPLNLALWTLYNALTDRLGLDRVVNLVVNLALFVGLGAVAGLVFGYWSRRQGEASDRDDGGEGGAPVTAPIRSAPGPRIGKDANPLPENDDLHPKTLASILRQAGLKGRKP